MRLCLRACISVLMLFWLTACGGGGEISRDTTTTTDDTDVTISVSLTIANTDGSTASNLTPDNSLLLTASVVDSDGSAVANRTVTFTFADTSLDLARFDNNAGTATTNADGIATIGLTVGVDSGSTEVTASLSSGEVSSPVAFTSEGDPQNNSELTIDVGLAITNQDGSTAEPLSVDNPLVATASVADSEGNPIANRTVTFTFSDTQLDLASFDNDAGTATTNEQGIANIGLIVGQDSGSAEVTATLSTGETSTPVAFTSEGTPQTSEDPASLDLFVSAIQLASSGTDVIEVIAVVKNAQNALMEGIQVDFSADNRASLSASSAATAADGTARIELTTTNEPENRDIVVTASTSDFQQSQTISVVGSEVVIDGASSIIVNDTVELTIRVQDSDGVPLASQDVVVVAENGNVDSTSTTTGANGQAVVNYTGTVSGLDTITATSLNADGAIEITVQQDEFSFTTLPDEEVALGEDITLTVTWNKDGVAFEGGEVTFTASRGSISGDSSTTTDANGEASFVLASNNAGLSSITATGTDNDDNQVSARAEIEFIATEPATLIVDASPDIIGPDGQTSTITAVVRDSSGNLVKGAVVNFNVDDVSTGSISPSESTTDNSGIATTVFTSGAVTGEDAVVITAEVTESADISDTVTLTVGNRAFDISLGTGNLIESPDNSTYLKEFAVFVTDSVGQPVSDVELTVSATPVKFANGGEFRKGFWQWDEDVEVWVAITEVSCSNEDINANGLLDLGDDETNGDGTLDNADDSNGNGILEAGEDLNDDTFLTPGIIGSVSFNEGIDTTDENGQATIELRYPREYAPWYDAEITVFAQSTGSEASASAQFTFTAAAEDLDDEGVSPPPNPFGQTDSCNTTQ